jgi:hypothetical protein
VEIRRSCKPPVTITKCAEPRRGDGMASRDFRRPGRGSDSMFTKNRWFAPPANFQCPFGTTRSLSHTNSRDAMSSSGFEVEDFAKRIRSRSERPA